MIGDGIRQKHRLTHNNINALAANNKHTSHWKRDFTRSILHSIRESLMYHTGRRLNGGNKCIQNTALFRRINIARSNIASNHLIRWARAIETETQQNQKQKLKTQELFRKEKQKGKKKHNTFNGHWAFSAHMRFTPWFQPVNFK